MTRVLVVGVLFAVVGCGGDERAPKLEQAHSDIEQPSTSDDDELDVKLCTDGQTQECKVTLSEHNGIVTCYVGVQSCVDGNWGECGGGEVVIQEATNEEPDYGLGP